MGVLHIRKLVFNCPVHWSREEGAMAGLISAAALNNGPELRHQAKVRVEDHEVGKYRIELILKGKPPFLFPSKRANVRLPDSLTSIQLVFPQRDVSIPRYKLVLADQTVQ
jgi:hypothetical protein